MRINISLEIDEMASLLIKHLEIFDLKMRKYSLEKMVVALQVKVNMHCAK